MLTVALCALGGLGWALAMLCRYDARQARGEAAEAHAMARMSEARASASRAIELADASSRDELRALLKEQSVELSSARSALAMAHADLAAFNVHPQATAGGSKELYDSTAQRLKLYAGVVPTIRRGDE